MYSIGDALREFGGSHTVKAKFADAKVLNAWGEVVGPAVKENTRAQRITNGILFVKTKSPSWAQELKVLDTKIKRALNERLGAELVKEIRFSYDGAISRVVDDGNNEPTPAPDIEQVELTEDEQDFIEAVTTRIEDDDLRRSVERLVRKNKKLNRWREEHG